jgi:hypothetical protein
MPDFVPGMRKHVLALALIVGALFAPLPAIVAPGFAQAPPPVPAEPDTERRTRYTGVSSVTTFNVGFDVYGDGTDYTAWIEVWVNSVKQTGNWSLVPVSGSFSTLSRPLLAANLNVVFTAAQSGTVDIVGARRPRRTSQLAENRGVTARDFNQLTTDLWMTARERWDRAGRTLMAPPGETLNTLAAASARAGQYLCFDPTGQPTLCVNSGGTGSLSAGTGITFTGSNPTSISANITGGTGISVAPSGGAQQVSMANMAANTAKCNSTGSSAAPQDCTGAQLAAALGIAPSSFVNRFTSNHTIANTDCNAIVQMGTGSTGQLTATLPGATTGFADGCKFWVYNGDAYSAGNARGKILSNFPSECFYILFPHQVCEITVSNSAFVVTRPQGRWQQAGAAIYAANAGSNTSNDCLSLATACQTLTKLMSIIYNNVDNQNSMPTLFLKGGDTFSECITAQGQLTGVNVGLIASSTGTGTAGGATWGNVTGACPGNALFTIADNAEWQVQNLFITNGSGTSGIHGLHMHQTAILDILSGMNLGMFAGSNIIDSDGGGAPVINMPSSGLTITGGGGPTPAFVNLGSTATVNECGACTTTFVGSPTIATLYAVNGAGAAVIFGSSHLFSGTAGITNACSVNGPSMISKSGASIPGTTGCTSGAATNGGQVF